MLCAANETERLFSLVDLKVLYFVCQITAGTRDVPPNTPNIPNLELELMKEGKKQAKNLKEHLENVGQNSNFKISSKAKKSTPKYLNFS